MEQTGKSFTVTVCEHVLLHPLESTIVKSNVKEPGAPAFTDTVWLVAEPLIVPLPEIDQM
jgi:hypothetical protein